MIPVSTPVEELAEKLNALVPDGECGRFALRAGLQPETLSRLRTGEARNPTLKTLSGIASALGMTVAELVSAPEDSSWRVAEPPTLPYGDASEYVPVPYYAVQVSAGPGAIIDDHAAPQELHLMRREWVKRHVHGRPIRVRVSTHHRDGESMIPTIQPGAILTVDLERAAKVRPGGIYLVVNDDGWVSVKRVYPMPEARALLCVSDNPAHPPFTIHPDRDGARVLGRVLRWEQGEE